MRDSSTGECQLTPGRQWTGLAVSAYTKGEKLKLSPDKTEIVQVGPDLAVRNGYTLVLG